MRACLFATRIILIIPMICYLIYYCRLEIMKGNLLLIKTRMRKQSLHDLCACKVWQSTNLLVSMKFQCNSSRIQDDNVNSPLEIK